MVLQHKQQSPAPLDWRKDPDVIAYEKRRAELVTQAPNLQGKLTQAKLRVQALEKQLEEAELQAALDPTQQDQALSLGSQLRAARREVEDIEDTTHRVVTAHKQALARLRTGTLPSISAARQRSKAALQAEFANRLRILIEALKPAVAANVALKDLYQQAYEAFPDEMVAQFDQDTAAEDRTWALPDVVQSAGLPLWLIWQDLLPMQHTAGEDIASKYVAWLNQAQEWLDHYEASQKGKR